VNFRAPRARSVHPGLVVWGVGALLLPSLLPAQVSNGEDLAPVQPGAFVPARPTPVSVYGYPEVLVNQDSIVALLIDGRFSDLERLLGSLQAATRSDIRREVEFEAAFRSFHGRDASIKARLDEWVASDPRSDAALVARAQFHEARAWEGRGQGRTVGDLDLLRREWAEGMRDALRAIQLDPDNLAAHVVAIRLHQFEGWSSEAEARVEQALVRFPTSYWLRFRALSLMEPRWGGSHELMRRFAGEAQHYVGANPRLEVLLGLPLIDEAATLWFGGRYDDALEKLEEARRFGTDWHFHLARGRALFHGNQATAAVAALDSAVAILPVAATVLEYRGLALFEVARRVAAPDDRVRYLERSIVDLRDAVKRGHMDGATSGRLADALAARARCAESPDDCFEISGEPTIPRVTGPWWWQVVTFVVSVPYTLYLVFLDGERMHLLPLPLTAAATCLWSFREWRRQRFWTPAFVHILAALGLTIIVAINIDWVRAGGEMWTQRYVVIAIFALFPYVAYLTFLGPHSIGRMRARREPIAGRVEED
jgi:tetratricopeptide (TPR) repeat protein